MKLFVAVALFAVLCSAAFGQHAGKAKPVAKGDGRATFAAMYKRAEAMFAKKDAKGISMGMTADFTETIDGRKANKDQSAKGLQQFMGMFQTLTCKFNMKSCKVNGNTAVTKDTVHLSGPASAADPKTHKRAKIDATRDETFTWVKQGGNWMVKSITASHQKIMINGKLMPMTGKA
jgi:hypothetical protein